MGRDTHDAGRPAPAEPGNSNCNKRQTPRLCSESLFGGATTLIIEHRGASYQLRQTRQGKLILTK